VRRQTEAGYDIVEATLPAVVSVTAGVNEPRYPSLKGIMAAKSKPVDRPTLADLGLDGAGGATAGQEIVAVEPAEERKAGEIIEDDGTGAQRVVAFLEQLKVI
jgi:electron transfer flavoprotein beta subunit